MKKKEFSAEDCKIIIDMYKNGVSAPMIARQYQCSNRPIYRILHEHNIDVDTNLRKVPKEDHPKIVEMYNAGMSQKEIAQAYGCSESVIWIIMRNLNAQLRPNGYTKEEADEMYKVYQDTKSSTEAARILNMDARTLRDVLNRYGFQLDRLKYHCNDNYFDVVDSSDQAYILGLLWSDGCNTLDRGQISLQLQEQDKHILDSINLLTSNERPLVFTELSAMRRNSQNTYTLTLKSDHMSSVLNDYGMVPRKSLVLQFPNWLDESLYADFMRGYVDGDGSIYFSEKKRTYRVSLVGTKSFLDKVCLICDELGVKTSMYHRDSHNDATYILRTTSNGGTITLLQWMYNEANLKLNRKYNTYQQIIDFYNINNSLTN
jgi:Mor family transcriptional regulator